MSMAFVKGVGYVEQLDIADDEVVGGLIILAVGNPFDGITLYGPFEDTEQACDYAEHEFANETWWLPDVMEVKDEQHKETVGGN